MPPSDFSFACSDALKLLQHRKHIDDLELALELLGLSISQSDLLTDGTLQEFEDIEDLGPPDDDQMDEWADQDEEYDEWNDENSDGLSRDGERHKSPWGRSHSLPSNSFKRSMVSYLLTADERTKETDDGPPVPETVPIEGRVQQVQSRLSVPDAEAWRVAIDVSDTAPRSHRPGKIDIRKCVNLIAQRKPIEVLPRVSASRSSRDPFIFIDARFSRGVFRVDVEQLVGALESIGIHAAQQSRLVVRRFSHWFEIDFSTGTLAPLQFNPQPAWYVIVTGGQPANSENIRDVRLLTDQVDDRSRVTIVWIGDELPQLPREESRKWIAYRS